MARTIKRSSAKKSARKKPKTPKDQPTPDQVAALRVERLRLRSLKPHERNPRIHPKKGSPEWEVLRKSLAHDYFDPIVWNQRNGKLVSGHLRRKVLLSEGKTHADVVVVDYDETTHLARLLAANKLIGEDDAFKLEEIVGELGAVDDFDMSLTGFTLSSVEELSEVGERVDGTEEEEDTTPTYTPTDLEELRRWFGEGAVPTYQARRRQVYRVNNNYLYIGSVLSGHHEYLPYLNRLKEEHPDKNVLLVPLPDPMMIGCQDDRVAALFIQPSPIAASLALTIADQREGCDIELMGEEGH